MARTPHMRSSHMGYGRMDARRGPTNYEVIAYRITAFAEKRATTKERKKEVGEKNEDLHDKLPSHS